MSKKREAVAPPIIAPPVHVTRWEKIWIEGGALYAAFWSGPIAHVVCMGPPKAFEAVARLRTALSEACVVPLQRH